MRFFILILYVLSFSTVVYAKKSITEIADSVSENYYEKFYLPGVVSPFTMEKVEELKDDLDNLQAAFGSVSQEDIENISFPTLWSEAKKLIEVQKKVTTSYENYCASAHVQVQNIPDSCPNPAVKERLKTIQDYINSEFKKRVTRLEKLMNKTFLSCGVMETESMYGFNVVNENLLIVSEKQIVDQNALWPLFQQKTKDKIEMDYGMYYLNNAVNICFTNIDNEELKKRKSTDPESGLYINFDNIKKELMVSGTDITLDSESFKKAKNRAFEVLNQPPVTDSFRYAVMACLQKQMQRFLDPEKYYGPAKIAEAKLSANRENPAYKGIFLEWNRAFAMRFNNKTSYEKATSEILSNSKCTGNVRNCVTAMQRSMYVETSTELCGDSKTRYAPGAKRPPSTTGGK